MKNKTTRSKPIEFEMLFVVVGLVALLEDDVF
jgi:hypothetical protein